MAYTTLDIVNSALLKIGARPLNSLEDDFPEARAAMIRYRQVMDTVLSLYPFSCALYRTFLEKEASYEKSWGYRYCFPLPNDCLHLWEVVDPKGDRLYDFSQEGQKLLSNVSTIGVLYSRRITDLGVIDHDVAELISVWLAGELSERIDSNLERTRGLKEQAQYLLQQIKTVDARRRAPRYYGEFDPFLKDSNDHPRNWVDSRL